MPFDRRLYPKNWRERATALKRAAGWRCQLCENKQGSETENRFGKIVTVVITVAHVDHDPPNPHARLAVWCRACHLRYDASHGQRGRKRHNMAKARGQLTLWREEV